MRDRGLLGGAALLFVASTAVTIVWCGSMSAMPGMDMPGGWTMSMAWMRMPGQSWVDAAATFLGMWTLMMIAMMTPSLVPVLARYRATLRGNPHRTPLTLWIAGGYFSAWLLVGAAAYPLGMVLAEVLMRMPALSQAVPQASGAVVMLAGLLQFSRWKARQLDVCRGARECCGRAPNRRHPWSEGLRLGFRCVRCCAGPTAVLLVVGVMDLGAMAAVTALLTIERLAKNGKRAAHLCGWALVATGLMLTA